MGRNSGIPCTEISGERWKDIPGWQPYQVSNLGRVRHWDGSGWYIVKSSKTRFKRFVVISCHCQHRTVMVDRLVAQEFIGPRPKGQRIIHLDHDLENNAAGNLEYANRQRFGEWFRAHQIAIGRTKAIDYREACRRKQERSYTEHYEAAQLWLSGQMVLKRAAATIGLSESALSWWITRHGLK